MPVTEDQVDTFRAFLAREFDKYRPLSARLDASDAWDGYTTLIAAGFFEAVDRRFSTDTNSSDIIRFVADARARFAEAGDDFDQQAGERLVRSVLGDGSVEDLEDTTVARAETALLSVLIADADLAASELDAFVTEVRKTADEWMP